jgi:DDE superfamily endonuclease
MIHDKIAKPISDLGYLGDVGITMPIKKSKLKKLTLEDKKFNKQLSKHRIIVEHTIGKMKSDGCRTNFITNVS